MAKRKLVSRKQSQNPVESRVNFLDVYYKNELQDALSFFKERFQASVNWRQQYRQFWIEMYQLWRGYSKYYDDRPAWQAGIFVPKPFEAVQTWLPRILAAIYDSAPLWTAIPRTEKDVKQAKMSEILLDSRARDMNLFMAHYVTFKEVLMYGTGIQKMIYDISPEYQGPRFYPLDIFDFYPEPYAGNIIQQMRWCFHRELKHIEEIMLLRDQGVYSDIDDDERDNDSSHDFFSPLDRQRIIGMASTPESTLEKDMHEILEYTGFWVDPESRQKFEVVVSIYDRKQIVRFEESPYFIHQPEGDYWYALKPFIDFHCVPAPHEFYSIGILEAAKSLFYELNDRRNAILDAENWALHPMWEVLRIGVEDMDNINMGPGELVEVRQQGAMQPLKKDMSFMSGFTETAELERNIEDATGSPRILSGSEPRVRATATETVAKAQEGNMRIREVIQINNHHALPAQAKMLLLTDRQFTKKEITARLFGSGRVQEFYKINPRKLMVDADFLIELSTAPGNRMVAVNQLLQYLEVLQGMPPEVQERIDYVTFMKRIGAALDVNEQGLIKEEEREPVPKPGESPLSLIQGGRAAGAEGLPTLGPSITPEEAAAVSSARGQSGAAGESEAVAQHLSSMFGGFLRT